MKYFFYILMLVNLSCEKKINTLIEPTNVDFYFPPNNSDSWETIEPEQLNWKSIALNDLYEYLEENNTRAFIILKDGKIVVEKYFGRTITNASDFDVSSQ